MPAKYALLRRGAEKRMFGGCALKASCRAEEWSAFSGSVCARHSREPPGNAGSLNLFPAPRKKPAEGGPFRGAEKRMFGGCALKASCRAEEWSAFSGSVCARHSREPPGNAGSLNLFPAPRKKPAEGGPFRGAEKRIRTSGRVTPVTRFPIVLLKPLRHLCKAL